MSEDSTGEPTGGSRFTVEERLGSGSAGVVYTAYDRQRGEKVALKALNTRDAAALYRFKREFRTLADVVHRNLVALYELVADDDDPFYTMELVDGVDFLEYVRPGGEEAGGLDEGRLRAALAQLATGIKALHDADKIHCDLKPTNVLVDGDGRVVILDFGISRDLAPPLTPMSAQQGLAGTVPYMAPEQCRGAEASPSSDWYAFGVMLFQALTGKLPFDGSLVEVLAAKTERQPSSPRDFAHGLPDDLVELTDELLSVSPESRPPGGEVLSRLGETEEVDDTVELSLGPGLHAFIGRGQELAALRDAFIQSCNGEATAVYVHGESGMGKTAFVEAFLRELVESAGALVLEGRCYEREIVPHKALDGVVDSLSRYFTRLRPVEIVKLLPENVRALSRLFPVLLRLDPIARAVRKAPDRGESDASGLRLHAMAALRQLLAHIAEERPLVLYVDDLQWADATSSALIDELLRPPEPPPLLLVGSFRSEELDEKPFLRDLTAGAGSDACRLVELGTLSDAAAGELARALLRGRPGTERLVDTIVREAGGSPFLVEQLIVYVEVTKARLESDVGLAEMLSALLERLPPEAARFLRTLAVAGRPLEAEIVHTAAGLRGDERPLVGALKAARLVRTSVRASHVELYHSRIREPLRLALAEVSDDEAERRVHLRLAELIQERGDDDPEALFAHLRAAGETAAAARAAMRAASRAAESLSFDRAAFFYRRALDLVSPEGTKPRELAEGLAEALAKAGRPHAAARAYLELAAEADAGDAVGYRRRAAEQLLAGGYFDEGMTVVRQVAEEVRIRIPASNAEAIATLVVLRLRLRLQGLGFKRREAYELGRSDLLRADSFWVMVVSLVMTRPLRSAALQSRHLLLALRLGEPVRLARALTFEAAQQATVGASARRRVDKLLAVASELAESVDDAYPKALHLLSSAVTSYLMGRWREGVERCARTEDFLARHTTGFHWDQTAAWRYGLSCCLYLGELREIRRRVPLLLEAARERGDVQAATELRTRFHVVHLMDDDVEAVRREIGQALADWTQDSFYLIHFHAMQGLCQAALYDGDAEEAFSRLEGSWRALDRSFLLRIQLSRIEAYFLRGRVGLATAAAGRREGISMAEAACRKLRREKADHAGPLALLLEAGLDSCRDDEARALECLTQATAAFEGQGLALFAAAGRRRCGELVGGDQGRELVAQADRWMREQGVRRPAKLVAVLAPGFVSAAASTRG